MRNRRRLVLAGMVASTLAGVALTLWLLWPPRITESAYEQIDFGQTLAEVEAIIGRAPGNYGGVEMREYLPRSVLTNCPNAILSDGEHGDLLPTAEVTTGFMLNQSWGLDIRQLKSLDEFLAMSQPVRKVSWLGPNCAIAVQFDAEDRVVNACLAKNFREPGPFERLLDWLGIRSD